MNIIKYKIWYLVFSVLILVPGILSILLFGLKLSVDFTGGSIFEYRFRNPVSAEEITSVFVGAKADVENVRIDGNNAIIRTKSLDNQASESVKKVVLAKYEGALLQSFQTVGPAIGKETTSKAFVALAWASVGILLYIAFAFRNVPSPYSSFRFGVSAIIAMLHDAVVVIGIFSILGHFYHVEVDSLFITAVLTIIGFSVHDTIVVFDRIRENLKKLPRDWNFEGIVNYSIVETLSRSLSTSLTVVFTLTALLVLGGLSIHNFVLALLVGIISGTYSSIFTAAPILVIWENYVSKKNKTK